MIPDDDPLRALIARPGESLNVEIKRRLDPSAAASAAKIVKAAFALRNRNGGFLVIGFDDVTLQPDAANEPPDVRAKFHQDDIQELTGRPSRATLTAALRASANARGSRIVREYTVC